MTVTPADVELAAERIAGRVRRTPIVDVDIAGHRVAVKLELLQHTGSFKPRGAFNRILSASEGRIPPAGVITASGGNHGAAVAYVASTLGVRAEVYVAEVTPEIKRDRIASFGAHVVIDGHQYPDAQQAADAAAWRTGALFVHAYDHPATVAGQGTMAREIEQDVPDVETVLVAVGGGGLVGGAAAWFGRRIKLVAVEPAGSRALSAALGQGHPVDVTIDSIAADSLGARRIGDAPFAAIAAAGVESVLVGDDDIRHAQRVLWDELRLIVEPGGATAMAALISGAYRPEPGERVVVVVCGANTDPSTVV
jgi:threonine dehydratase